MIIISCVIGLIAAGTIAAICYLVILADEVDERREELDKYSVSLDERANRIALEEEEISERNAGILRCRYVVTGSDALRYDGDECIRNAAKKQLAQTIANDIVRNIEPAEYTNELGMTVYEYKVWAK